MNPLVLLVGFKNCGKSTAALAFQNEGYLPFSFADAIKDTVSAIFCWPRDMMAGITPESRAWRETVDEWWATKLGIPHFTPRYAMEQIGTDVLRNNFDNNIWLHNVERRIENLKQDQINPKIILVDGRHAHEIAMCRRQNGRVIRIKRGDDPVWYDIALAANDGDLSAKAEMKRLGIHNSEWGWIGSHIDTIVENNGTTDDLHNAVLMASRNDSPSIIRSII